MKQESWVPEFLLQVFPLIALGETGVPGTRTPLQVVPLIALSEAGVLGTRVLFQVVPLIALGET